MSYRVKRSVCYNCPNTTAYPRMSFDTDCHDTIEQDHDVEFTDPPHAPVELSTPVHHLDERPVIPVNATNPTSQCHQDADYPNDVPHIPRRSLRQVKKPKWLVDYVTVQLPEEKEISGC